MLRTARRDISVRCCEASRQPSRPQRAGEVRRLDDATRSSQQSTPRPNPYLRERRSILELFRDRSHDRLKVRARDAVIHYYLRNIDKDGQRRTIAASPRRKLFRAARGLRDATLAAVAPVDADRFASAVVRVPAITAVLPRAPSLIRRTLCRTRRAPDLIVSQQQPRRSDVVTLHWSIPYDKVGGFAAYKARRPDVVAAHALAHGGPGGLALA